MKVINFVIDNEALKYCQKHEDVTVANYTQVSQAYKAGARIILEKVLNILDDAEYDNAMKAELLIAELK